MQRGLYQLISEAYSSDFLIDIRKAQGYLTALQAGQISAEQFGKINPKESALGAFTEDGKFSYVSSYNSLPPDSIAKINLEGALMRADGPCSYGMASIANMVRQADSSKSIKAILLEVDSPGGQVIGTEELANAIAQSSTPVYVLAHYAASAAYWSISGATEIWASAKTAELGSIGTMLYFVDTLPILENAGAKVHEIYADKSKDKNALFGEVRKGNYKAYIKEKLNPINEIFHASVRENRGLSDELMTGKTYLAEEALANGMIDRIGNINQLLDYINSNGSNIPQNQVQKPQNNTEMAGKNKQPSLWERITGKSDSEKEQIEQNLNQMNEDLNTATENSERLETLNNQLTATNNELQSQNTALETQLATAQEQVATLTKERDEAVALAESYGSQAGARPTAVEKTGQDVEQAETALSETDKINKAIAEQAKNDLGLN